MFVETRTLRCWEMVYASSAKRASATLRALLRVLLEMNFHCLIVFKMVWISVEVLASRIWSIALMVFVWFVCGCSISSGLGEQVQPTAQGRFDLVFCKEVLVWFWGDDPWPAFEVVFFEEITRVARGGFDFFKLGLSERDEARFVCLVHWVFRVGLLMG